ncbi:MAG: BBE domain-containing protein, partial [Caldilineaceae bacterium]|nr:BBE domain-containing protein [Caldilineaceae bacterium]
LQPLRELATPVVDLSHPMPYCAAQQAFDPFFPKGGHLYYNKSTDLISLDDAVLDALISRAGESPTPETVLVLWLYGGAMSRVGIEETAFSGRNVPALYSVDAMWDDPADSERIIGWARDYISSLAPYSAGGLYSNFAGDLEDPHAAYGRNHERLVKVKTKYDPTNFFRMNQNIQPQ